MSTASNKLRNSKPAARTKDDLIFRDAVVLWFKAGQSLDWIAGRYEVEPWVIAQVIRERL